MKDLKELKNLMFTEYPDLVDVKQLQKMLGINRHTAYDLINNGEIHAARVGRKFRIPKICVIEYLCRDMAMGERKVG